MFDIVLVQEQQTGRPALMGSGNSSGGYGGQDHREESAGCCGGCVVL